MFEERRYTDGGVGLALIRDGNGTRSFETLLRYRGAAMAEFWRALRTLKALQADARANAAAEVEAPVRPRAGAPGFAAGPLDRSTAVRKEPNEPKSPEIPGKPGQRRERASSGDAPSSSDPGRALLPPLPLALPGTAALPA